MRVISGTAKGRPLRAVPGMGTRPTTDKVKEAIFSRIGPYFDGGAVLDLFAGTGGLGIEALSRGMDTGTFIDADKKSIETVTANLQATRLQEQAETFRNDANRALGALSRRGRQFDLVFIDPPYKMVIIADLIEQMQTLNVLAADATIVAEHAVDVSYPDTIGRAVCTKRADYGEIAVSIYRMAPEQAEGDETDA